MSKSAAGERVLISGAPRVGKTLFFRAIAGLWPWGSGRIGLPAGEDVAFVPRSPYVPPGTLREVLCYPLGERTFADAELADTLAAFGLGRLSPMLDRQARWDRELNEDEQRLVAFARLVLHRPRFVVIDEALDTLEPEARGRILAIFKERLADAAIINIGQVDHSHFFDRVLNLDIDPHGRKTQASGAIDKSSEMAKA